MFRAAFALYPQLLPGLGPLESGGVQPLRLWLASGPLEWCLMYTGERSSQEENALKPSTKSCGGVLHGGRGGGVTPPQPKIAPPVR